MNKRGQVAKYVVVDVVGAAAAWTLFYLFRKTYMEPAKFGYKVPIAFDTNFWFGLALIPLFWVGLYIVIGGYADIFRRYRIKELGQTLLISLMGTVVILQKSSQRLRLLWRAVRAVSMAAFASLIFSRYFA